MAGSQTALLALAGGDVDGDGDIDLVLGNAAGGFPSPGQPNKLYLNDGLAGFTLSSGLEPPSGDTRTMAAGNGDGDVDLLFANVGQNSLWLNDGSGRFADATATHLPTVVDRTAGLVLADLDGDDDLDVVLGKHGQNRLWLNDGSGRFTDVTATHLPGDGDDTQALSAGDVDGDGDLDLVLANRFGTRQATFVLYRNDGRARFTSVTASGLPALVVAAARVLFGDVDGDGDPDAIS